MQVMVPKFVITCGVLAAHLIFFFVVGNVSATGNRQEEYRQMPLATAYIISAQDGQDTVPLPDVILDAARIDLTSLVAIQFEDPDEMGVVGSISAPRLSRVQPTSSVPFAIQAGLQPGQVVTVVLIVEVLPDGSVGTVSVNRGSGNSAVNAAAIEYARTLRWIAGTINQRNESMRISVPITLSIAS